MFLMLVEQDQDGPVAGSLEGVLQVCSEYIPGVVQVCTRYTRNVQPLRHSQLHVCQTLNSDRTPLLQHSFYRGTGEPEPVQILHPWTSRHRCPTETHPTSRLPGTWARAGAPVSPSLHPQASQRKVGAATTAHWSPCLCWSMTLALGREEPHPEPGPFPHCVLPQTEEVTVTGRKQALKERQPRAQGLPEESGGGRIQIQAALSSELSKMPLSCIF